MRKLARALPSSGVFELRARVNFARNAKPVPAVWIVDLQSVVLEGDTRRAALR
jgi:hypothetical protein